LPQTMAGTVQKRRDITIMGHVFYASQPTETSAQTGGWARVKAADGSWLAWLP